MHRCICCVFVFVNVVLFLFLQEFLLGDCTKAQTKLGWKHKYDFDVSIMLHVECQTRELLVPFLLRLWYDAILVGGIEPGISRTRSQHSTSRLSRRWCKIPMRTHHFTQYLILLWPYFSPFDSLVSYLSN